MEMLKAKVLSNAFIKGKGEAVERFSKTENTNATRTDEIYRSFTTIMFF